MKSHHNRFLPLALIGSVLALVSSGHLQAETLYNWTGATSTDWITTTNWTGGVAAPTGATADVRLRVANAANNTLIYSAAEGNTTYANTTGNGSSFRGLVIATSSTAGSMEITGGNFSTVGSLSADNIGSVANGTLTVSGGSYTGTSVGTILGQNSSGGISTLIVGGSGSATVAVLQMSGATAIVNLDGGTLTANQIVDVDNFGAAGLSNTTFNFNGGTLTAGSGAVTAFMTGLSNAYVLSGGAKIDTNGKDITIGQALLGGGGGLTKSGAGMLTLSAGNTYTGNTTVSEGTLSIGSAYLADASSVIIATGAKMDLTFSGDDTVASVKLGATTYTAPGSYNATTYPVFFTATSTGSLVIPPGGYGSWATTNSVLEGENGDDDDDGISNLVEYALGLDPQDGDPAPGTFTGNTLTFTKGTEAKAALDVTYKIQTSTTLATGSWTDAAATDTTNDISFLLPPNQPGGKLFGRLQVTKP